MKIYSSAFKSNELIPAQYTCDGENISPPLQWEGVPNGAKSLVLIVDDPDAPAGVWVHWILFNLPATLTALPSDLRELPPGSMAATNSWSKQEYGGPCPPNGRHHYYFKLYALDVLLDIKATAGSAEIETAMQGHILASANLVGVYR